MIHVQNGRIVNRGAQDQETLINAKEQTPEKPDKESQEQYRGQPQGTPLDTEANPRRRPPQPLPIPSQVISSTEKKGRRPPLPNPLQMEPSAVEAELTD